MFPTVLPTPFFGASVVVVVVVDVVDVVPVVVVRCGPLVLNPISKGAAHATEAQPNKASATILMLLGVEDKLNFFHYGMSVRSVIHLSLFPYA